MNIVKEISTTTGICHAGTAEIDNCLINYRKRIYVYKKI